MKNTYEQSFIEKLRSLLKFGANSRRYKDIFDMYYLRIVVSENKMKELGKSGFVYYGNSMDITDEIILCTHNPV